MRIHTRLTEQQVRDALQRAKDRGNVAQAVTPIVFAEYPSQDKARAFEVQLGAPRSGGYVPPPANAINAAELPQKIRHVSRAGYWAATWSEWGWFLAELFRADPIARTGTRPRYDGRDGKRYGYFDRDDFNAKTRWLFDPE